jgi:peptide subunit release factor 1 (eRF1)
VLVESRVARVCEVVLGGFLAQTAFANDVSGHHKQGDWAQMRYERHTKEHMDQHHKEVAEYLATYLTKRPHTVTVLAGPTDSVANFRAVLSPAVQARILDSLRRSMRDTPAEILEAARDVLWHTAQEEGAEPLQLLLDRAGRGGLAVVGLQGTLEAVHNGHISQLIMHRDVHVAG